MCLFTLQCNFVMQVGSWADGRLFSWVEMPESLAQDPAGAEEPGEKAKHPGLEIRLFEQMRYDKSAVRGLSFDLQSAAQEMGDFKPAHAWEMKRQTNKKN